MPNHKKTMLVLPDEVRQHLAELTNTESRNIYIASLRKAEWTLQSIAEPLGISRERVRQIVAAVEDDPVSSAQLVEVPEPPLVAVKEPPVYIEPAPATLERLLELQPLAQQVRANSPAFREEAEEYTRLINYAHEVEGVKLYRLALRLGVTHGALRFRLARYGYKTPDTGTSKVYEPIKRENRAI